ncbi:putative protein kinase [Aspergillus candidus]|uniref:Protein kinase-like protein n=1 Tax=Aspergillus candidus TaxID=41067 RepID=A0A2I2FIX3_ASPCN|nr:protein kinase-like protein [Aspergillus candidus]PLB40564.1 protein kinase-like protein [Aspergillus candidus]
MSMFKSAADNSSSDSQPSFDESEHHVVASTDRHAGCKPQFSRRRTSPPSLQAESQESQADESKDALDVDADGHANYMTAALLEFYCMSRAADLLNTQNDSHKRFTRDSPEVQYLGKKMYTFKSRFLSSVGVLADGVEKDELRSTRQYYRDTLDMIGASALDDLKLDDAHAQTPPIGGPQDVVLASRPPGGMPIRPDSRSAGFAQHPRNRRPDILDIEKLLTSGNGIGMGRQLENIHLDPANWPIQPSPLIESSPASFPLFSGNLPPPINRLSRYAVEFSEVKFLGRGSFGEVYHVKNHIDGQDYAVKKIPLSQKRLEQLQRGGGNHLETIMKEIRTLARLEHANVVRYYGAWVEQHQAPNLPPASPPASFDHTLESTQSSLAGPEPTDNQSFGVVFENTEDSIQPSVGETSHSSSRSQDGLLHAPPAPRRRRMSYVESVDESSGEVESIPRNFSNVSHSQTSTFVSDDDDNDDDIFTDGLSHNPSNMQIQRSYQKGSQIPAVVLHIQMSLHPLSLGSYLNPQSPPREEANSPLPRRHCYHLVPSLKLILSIISGVEYLHSKGIVHRDLKPANIFLSSPENRQVECCFSCQLGSESASRYCNPRIGDFGLVADISHFNEQSPQSPTTTPQGDLKLNHVVGTEFYRPSLGSSGFGTSSKGDPYGKETAWYTIDETLDIFSLGVILFELLYRLGTRMERQLVLSELTRGSSAHSSTSSSPNAPIFPADFAQKIDQGHAMLPCGVSIAESVMTCIRQMLNYHSHQHWNCVDVRKHLEMLLASVDKR